MTVQVRVWESSCHRWNALREAAAFEMSSKEAARAMNRLAREGFDLLGTSDGSALFKFVEEYLCGDNPDDYEDDLYSGKVPFKKGNINFIKRILIQMKWKMETWLLLVILLSK